MQLLRPTSRQSHFQCARRRGATSIVEFAIILPVLLSILLGIVEFGWMVKNNLTLANATREGARTASLGSSTSDIYNRVNTSATPLSLTSPKGSILLQYSADGGLSYQNWPADSGGKNGVPVGSLIKITCATSHTTLTSFFPFLNNRQLVAAVTMRREF